MSDVKATWLSCSRNSISLTKREISAEVAVDMNPLHHSAKCWLVCEEVISEKGKGKDITYHANNWRHVKVNIPHGVDILPDCFQSLNHFLFIDVKWVIHMPCCPVQYCWNDLTVEFWLCTLRQVPVCCLYILPGLALHEKRCDNWTLVMISLLAQSYTYTLDCFFLLYPIHSYGHELFMMWISCMIWSCQWLTVQYDLVFVCVYNTDLVLSCVWYRYCLISCTIHILSYLVYNTHLRAAHTTSCSIRGAQIPIVLVNSAMDSLCWCVAVFNMYL